MLPLERFLTGYRQTALRPDELLTAVLIPRGARDDARSAFLKLGLRRYLVISVVMVAVVVTTDPDDRIAGGQGRDRRMLAGGTATAITRGGARRPVDRRCGRRHDRRASRRAQPDRRCPRDGGLPTPGGGGVGAPRAPELRGRPLSAVTFDVNGSSVRADRSARRLSDMLRDDLGFTATKVGCDAGDCGACTVLLDGEPVSACMTPVGGLAGRQVQTLEGLHASGECHGLQTAFLMHGAAQCGICTPGMLVSAAALLRVTPAPTEQQVMDALGGVLCRCTGYRKIITAVMNAGAAEVAEPSPPVGKAVGHRVRRVDGQRKVDGTDVFGADDSPAGALVIRVVRSPFHRARFQLGDLDAYVAASPGVVAVLTAADIPGRNRFGVIPATADQPVFAEPDEEVRFRGEAVAMIVGEPEPMAALDTATFPVVWSELPPVMSIDDAQASGAPRLHATREGNVLIRGNVRRGELDQAFAAAEIEVEGVFETGFIEHAYIEPEAGYAERIGDRVEVQVTTQSPHMDRIELEAILGLPEKAVRIKPTAVGGGFGSKLDLSVQPYLALAAWTLGRPVRLTYTRPESMMSTTKRHPSRLRARVGATRDGRLTAMDFSGEFNTGAYASWGSTVANRVPGARRRSVRLRRVSRAHRGHPHERATVGRVPWVRRAAIDDRAGMPVR